MNDIVGSNPLSGPFLSNSISKRWKMFVANKNRESLAKLSPKITVQYNYNTRICFGWMSYLSTDDDQSKMLAMPHAF